MKYLKTYKLFESNINEVIISSESDWEKVNDSTTKITINYQCNKLHELPKSLRYLYCSYNQLTELPVLPSTLQKLFCSNNKLKELPKLPNLLHRLDCQNNQLIELPTLPKSSTLIQFYNNPLNKLPKGITKELLKHNNIDNYVKDNVLTWLKNDPSSYEFVKDYLTEAQQKYFEENGAEGLEDLTQFGMFNLKNKE